MYDFSHLPDVVWVRILSYLSLADRSAVASTSHALNDAFNHPSLWYKSKISLLANGNRNSENAESVFISNKHVALIKRFGKYFQNLELHFLGYVSAVPQHIVDVLTALADNCRYETLTLSVGTVLSKRDFWWERPDRLDIDPILMLVENSYRLQTLNVISWPMYRTIRSPNIMNAIRNNDKNKTLTALNLFYKTAEDSTWTTLNAQLPSQEEVVTTIKGFPHLTSLKLQSTMLSTDLIWVLAKRHRSALKRLAVLVTYAKHDPAGTTPDIPSEAWVALKHKSPDLNVDFTFVTLMPYVEKAAILKSEIPVASLNFMKYSACTKEDLLSFIDKYSSTLKKISDYSMADGLDEQVSLLVENCTKLNYFLYAGSLNYHTVTSLAKLRGRAWYHFQINSKSIVTTEPSLEHDTDTVLTLTSDGTYQFASALNYQDELHREAVLEVMMQEVGMHLGQKWLPMDVRGREKEDLVTKIYGNPFNGNKVPTWLAQLE